MFQDPPVIYLAGPNRVLDLDKPSDQEQWREFTVDSSLTKDNDESSSSTSKPRFIGQEWKLLDKALKLSQLPGLYLQLSKFRLTMLVAATSAGGYGMVNTEVISRSGLIFGTSLVSAQKVLSKIFLFDSRENVHVRFCSFTCYAVAKTYLQ